MARRSVRLGEPRSVCIPRRQPHPKPSPGSSTWQLCAWQLLGRQCHCQWGNTATRRNQIVLSATFAGQNAAAPPSEPPEQRKQQRRHFPFNMALIRLRLPELTVSTWDLHGISMGLHGVSLCPHGISMGSPWVSMGLHGISMGSPCVHMGSPWDLHGSPWVSRDLRGIRVASPCVFGDPRASSDVLNMFYPCSHWDFRGSPWDLRGIFRSLHEV
jgi:hypothetical protein